MHQRSSCFIIPMHTHDYVQETVTSVTHNIYVHGHDDSIYSYSCAYEISISCVSLRLTLLPYHYVCDYVHSLLDPTYLLCHKY